MLKIAVCDDEPNMVAHICKLIEKNPVSQSGGIVREGGLRTDSYRNGNHLLQAMEDGLFYDLIYLDIEMGDIDGINLAKRIREQDEAVLLVYVSSHDKYMIDLFEVQPFRFIRKPIEKKIFDQVLEQAVTRLLGSQCYFSYESGWNECRVLIRDILYFESDKRKIIIVTEKSREAFYGKLDEIEERLKQMNKCFIRIHQSYLINPEKVMKVGAGKVCLVNQADLPVSKKRQKEVNEQYLQQYWR